MPLKKPIAALLCLVLAFSLAGCGKHEVPPEADFKSPVNESSSEAAGSLEENYPEYFGLPTDKGLEVYVWQMAQNSYSFGLLPGTNREKTLEELCDMKGASAAEMKAILSTYDIDEQNVFIYPWQNPISSFIPDYWISEEGEDRSSAEARKMEYVDHIRRMLFAVIDDTDY